MKKVLVEAKEIKKYFPIKGGFFRKTVDNVKAVDNVSFNIFEGETLGLVGESGCGKSTLGRTLIKLYQPTDGKIIYNGTDITNYSRAQMKPLRQDIQIIFQDPYSSLNPRMNVSSIISEPLLAHGLYKKGTELNNRIIEIMQICGLPSYYMYRYPHQFSGGQRQRIGIARALALNPDFVVCDEPVSALDVSIQSQILNLMMDLQERMNLSYLFISHNLSVVKHISQRVGVMYLGSLVEIADKKDLYRNPAHPYTRALLAAIPLPDPEHIKELNTTSGDLPGNVNTPSGCKFHTRCPHSKAVCAEQEPAMIEIEKNHFVKCHFAGEI